MVDRAGGFRKPGVETHELNIGGRRSDERVYVSKGDVTMK